MKILQLISSGGFYGAENALMNLSIALDRLGCESIVGVFQNAHRPNNEVADFARRQGLRVVEIPCRGRADWGTVRAIRNCIRECAIDLVHSHGYKSNLYGYAAVRPLGVPIVATCHNWTRQSASLRLYETLDRLALRRFSRVVAVSATVAESLRSAGVAPERITAIDNGVDLERFAGASEDFARGIEKNSRLVAGMVGRLVPEKGPEYFLRAAAQLTASFPEALFVLVGEGPARPRLEQLARELKIERQVIFTGQRDDLPSVYAAMDVFVLPSLNEGMPMTILEAMAAGKPVVATRVGAVPQLVAEGETGFLVEPKDVEELKDAMAMLLGDAGLRARCGANGHNKVKRDYSSQTMANKYLDLYHEVLEPRSALPSASRFSNDQVPAPERESKKMAEGNAQGAAKSSRRVKTSGSRIVVSVIIPARNEEECLGKCLESLCRMDYPRESFEVILVDNGSTDRTVEVACEFSSRLNIHILEKTNARISALRNLGASIAQGSVFAFLDADTEVPVGWLRESARLVHTEGVGVVGADPLNPEDATWIARTWMGGRANVREGNVTYISTSSLVVAAENFFGVGGFDESIMTNEDCEFCGRVRASGLSIQAYPHIAVVHFGVPRTLGEFFRKQMWHGTHVFKVFLRELPSLVNTKAVFFALYMLAGFFGLAWGAFYGLTARDWTPFEFLVLAALFPSLYLGMRGAILRKRLQDALPLAVLYLTYGTARAFCIIDVRNWVPTEPQTVLGAAGNTGSAHVQP